MTVMINNTTIISVITCATALFIAIMISLAVPPKLTKRIITIFACLTAAGSLLFYGFGYAMVEDNLLPAIIRTTFAVCKVFAGTDAWDEISDAFMIPELAFVLPLLQVIFWLLHLMGLFTSASALIAGLGSSLLRRLRLWALRRNDISLIFGLNKDSLDFGQEQLQNGITSVLYVDKNPDSTLSSSVDRMGMILRTDTDAVGSTVRFLKSIGLRPGKRNIWIYALSTDHAANHAYAQTLLESLKKRKISPEQTSLTIVSSVNDVENRFLNQPGHPGFGTVIAINEGEMVARMLVQLYPPCDCISFDKFGCAENNFHGLLIGFGPVGQAVLKQLVMNGQFQGSSFQMAVFSPDYPQRMGFLSHDCSPMLEHYDITFYPSDGRSCQLYDYIEEHIRTLNYIVLCTGDTITNIQIAEQLQSFLKRYHSCAPVYMCSHQGIFYHSRNDRILHHKVYTRQVLCTDQIDRMAMILNQAYAGTGDMLENWRNCSYFNRMSSRAAADSYRTILRAAGVTAEQARKNWAPSGELLENLAISEHLRWNAFHYAMGFRPMTEAEFNARAEIFRSEKQKNSDTTFRIARDMDQRIHACMIPWDALDTYSAKENAITGKNRNYKENDRKNILALGDLLQTMDGLL